MSRIVIYDASPHAAARSGIVADSWRWGAALAKWLGRCDVVLPAISWSDLEAKLKDMPPFQRVEVWGHGAPGLPALAGHGLDTAGLERLGLATRPVGADALWWWRSCATFHGAAGQTFARQGARVFGCRTAGHTFDTGRGSSLWKFWDLGLQSGLHVLAPGETPAWPIGEGADEKGNLLWSSWTDPSSIPFWSRGPR